MEGLRSIALEDGVLVKNFKTNIYITVFRAFNFFAQEFRGGKDTKVPYYLLPTPVYCWHKKSLKLPLCKSLD